MAWNPVFVLLIIGSTCIDFVIGGKLASSDDPVRRRRLLIASLTANLGLLAIFKYAGMFQQTTIALLDALGVQAGWTTLHVVLPVGISFYTFQTLSYSIDVYRRRIPATHSPLDFALFVAFFPQLLAGPIVRAAEFLPQLSQRVKISCSQENFFLILRGLTKKVVIADNIGRFSDAIFNDPEPWPSIVIWLAAICFSIQIYCDFSGYSDMAIGIARVLGFKLPRNFDHPYFARNPAEFWRKWHISLSSWLRDYLYIPLGGNRGSGLQLHRNLMLTMLLGGLWHGASWNFVLWGFLHGFALIAHRLFLGLRGERPAARGAAAVVGSLLSRAALLYWLLLTWIAFRVRDFDQMSVAIHKFVFFDFDLQLMGIGLGSLSVMSTLILIAMFLILHFVSMKLGGIERLLGRLPLPAAALVCLVLGVTLTLLWPLHEAPFIYFQF
jgi:D-alanyl-lipoteichoic acid acyltransferase DltB (MBOAT superfamily)